MTPQNGSSPSVPLHSERNVRADEGSLLLDVWALMRRRKGLLAFGLVAGLVLAGLYYLKATRIYEAQVQILVMQKDTRLPTQGVEGDRGEETSASNSLLSTHVQVFKSPRVIQQAIEKHRLEELASVVEASEKTEAFSPVEHVLKHLVVNKGGEGQGRDARVLRARFRAPSAEDAAAVLDAMVQSYQDFLGGTFQDTSSEAVKLITQAKQDLESELEKAEQAYRVFREQSPLLSRGEKSGNPHEERMREIETALTSLRLRRAEVKTRLEVIREALRSGKAAQFTDLDRLALIGRDEVDRISLMLAATRGDALTSEAFQAKQPLRTVLAQEEFQQLLTLALREREMLEDYGADHPEVQKVRKQMETAREFLVKKSLPEPKRKVDFGVPDLFAAHMGLLEHDYAQLQKREGELTALSRREEEGAKKLVSTEIRDEMLRSDITRKRGLYDAIIERLKKINLIKDYGGFITQVISPVETPKKPVSPVLFLIMGLGAVLGLASGAGLAYVVDLADRTFRSPEEVHRALDLPLLAEVPPIRMSRRTAAGDGQGPAIQPRVVAYHRPRSREAEAIRGLRTSLYFSTRRSGQKVIQVTSANAGDGKTTLTVNLAVTLAQSGKKVLLVDADLHRPTVHLALGLDPSVGLSSVIVEDAELPDAIQTVGIENLWVLPSGPCPPNPSDLLTSPNFEQFLRTVREQYDYVIVDSPPVLAVSDPAVIAPRADGVILTTRIIRNGAPGVIQAHRTLLSVEARMIGVVVNGFQKDKTYGSYGSYGGYGSGYGNDEQNARYHHDGEPAETGHGETRRNGNEEGPHARGRRNGTAKDVAGA